MRLEDDVRALKGVGEAAAKQFARLGIHTLRELIDYYPRVYEDYSTVSNISQLRPGKVTIRASIDQAVGRYARRGMHITEAIASDATGSVRIIWFNQPYRAAALKRGQEYFVSGNFELRHQQFAITPEALYRCTGRQRA
jgi:ATP-dependent DNA helicase RecG